jgi:MoaD family protein
MSNIIITVRAFANFQSIWGAQKNIIITQGQTVRDLLEILFEKHSDFRTEVFNFKGQLSEHIDIIINGRTIGHTTELTTKLQDGDQVFIFPALSGG